MNQIVGRSKKKEVGERSQKIFLLCCYEKRKEKNRCKSFFFYNRGQEAVEQVYHLTLYTCSGCREVCVCVCRALPVIRLWPST